MALTPAFFRSSIPDGSDTSKLRPSDWNYLVDTLTSLLGGSPALKVQSASLSDSNAAFVVRSPIDASLGALSGKVNFFINPIGNVYLNTSLNLAGNHAFMGSFDANGNFVLNGDPRGNSNVASMLDIWSDTNVSICARTSTALNAYAVQFLDPDGAFVHSIESNGNLKWGPGGNLAQGGAQDHSGEDTTLARVAAGYLMLSGTAAPSILVGNSLTDAVMMQYAADRVVLRKIIGNAQSSVLDVSCIAPANTFDFSVQHGNTKPLIVYQTGAVDNTVVLKAGKTGINNADPKAILHVTDGAGSVLLGNNGFGNDWMVFTQDAALGAGNFFLAIASANGVILNARNGKKVSLSVNNGEIAHFTQTDVAISLGSLPTADPHAANQLWRSGTALQISLG